MDPGRVDSTAPAGHVRAQRSVAWTLAGFALLLVAATHARAADEDLRALDARFREVAARAIPATVLVKSTLGDGTGRSGFGSGAVISADGYVLTCSHVIDMAGQVEVAFADGESAPARVLSKNPQQDYALLKVEREGLPYFPIGDSRALRLGQWVVALGHPGGPYPDLRPAVSVGRVTGLHRRLPVQMMERNYDDAIRTDAPIYAGNSGGPLVTLDGALVGLNGAILLVNENSYAVPVHEIVPNLERMKRGEAIAGRAGASGAAAMEEFEGKDLARFLGKAGRRLLGREGLGKLIPGSGAERDQIAGVLDRIGKSLEGERAQGVLESLLGGLGGDGGGDQGGGSPAPGGEAPALPDLDGLRKRIGDLFGGDNGGDAGKSLEDLMERLSRGFDFGGPPTPPLPPPPPTPAPPPAGAGAVPEPARPPVVLGVALAEVDDAIVGVRLAAVPADGPAYRAGLRPGDLLVRIDQRKIGEGEDIRRALEGRRPGERLTVTVLRPRSRSGEVSHEKFMTEVVLAPLPQEGK